MPNDTEQLITMSEALGQAPAEDGLISMKEAETGIPDAPSVVPISDEHKNAFLQNLGDAVYQGITKPYVRLAGSTMEAVSGINDVIGFITGLNSFKKYRESFVESGQQMGAQAKESASANNPFEREFFRFVDAMGYMAPTLLFDTMTGGLTKVALAGRILPKMEAILARVPNFAVGAGWRGMVHGIEAAGENPVQQVVGGIVGGAEETAIGTLYGAVGGGLKGIGKMAALGTAQAFYNAAKEGRMPTTDEIASGSTQNALMGVVFTALPHIAEGSKIGVERNALTEYSKKFERSMSTGEKTADIPKLTESLLTDERIRPEIRESLAQPFLDRLEQRGKISDPEFELGQWKDRSKLRMMRETMERNIENVAGKDADTVKFETTEKIKENETFHQRWQTELNNLIQGPELVGRGIKPNSKESQLMMRYGEGRMTEAALQADLPGTWKNVKEGAEFCRKVYDQSLTAINDVRARYGYEPILKRDDYFRHFQEINAAAQLFGHFLGGEKPPTSIAGVVNRTKYGKPFSSTEMERVGNQFKEDGVLALQDYIKSAGPQLFHLDSVQRVRTLERFIRSQALINETKIQNGQAVASLDLSNFTEKLSTYADFLAGQPSALTKAVNENVDRPVIAGVRAVQKNVVANMIADNISSAFMNFLPGAQQVATTNPKAVAKGLVTSFLHLNREEPFILDGARSEFYDRRYPKGFLPANWAEKISEKGYVLPNIVDRFMVQGLIAGKYWEGKAKGLEPEAAMKAADNYAVRVVADRTAGQLPSIMTEPNLKLFTAFQVEVNNLLSWLAHDVPIESQGKLAGTIGRIAVFAIAANVLNNLFEQIMGRRPVLDPLYILATVGGWNKSGKDRGFLERLMPAGKDLIGNVPFGNLFVQGGRFPLAAALPDMNVVLQDPEHRALSEFLKPTYYLLNPLGGGGQIRKTIEGIQTWSRGYVATPSQNIRYEVQKDFYNFVRGFLFGKNSFPEAVKYWNEPASERN